MLVRKLCCLGKTIALTYQPYLSISTYLGCSGKSTPSMQEMAEPKCVSVYQFQYSGNGTCVAAGLCKSGTPSEFLRQPRGTFS